MPEAKHFQGDRSLGCAIDWDNFAYQNKMREKQRLETLNAAPADPAEAEAYRAKRKRNTEAWSGKHEQEETRAARREKKQKKREAERKEKMTEAEKAQDMDLTKMLAAIRRQNQEKYAKDVQADIDGGDDDFEGFD
jgi:ATP-dependent RNA helicase DDX55/SPB4